jgi:FAD/FMN-containing dehydrogenase
LVSAALGVLVLLAAAPVVNDVSRLNPIAVEEVLVPASVEEIVEAVKTHPGPISIGGARHSMGGQTATEHALQIDMRRFDRVLSYSKEQREITVETGITWRKIQELIDPDGLSVQVMQSYANFTVGGSLSVNVHGRYIGQGPLVMSVRSIRIVLADGSVVTASPSENSEIFYGAIGGYGAMGVIVDATLSLTDDVKVERESVVMPLTAYGEYFAKNIRGNAAVVFHNGDIYPNAFDTVRATSYVTTDKPVTIARRLQPLEQNFWLRRLGMRFTAELPGGNFLREHLIDPWVLFRGACVEWRNYEASYDARELEPVSRRASTYVLQEYFVPVDRFDQFATKLGEILRRYDVDTVNVSIRHANQDPGTLLAWAKTEVFAFVLYYRQGTLTADRERVGRWTRELIDAATENGGSYYLPYQIHATEAQFRAAYPNAGAFFALKERLDPADKFRNKLWDAYDHPAAVTAGALGSAARSAVIVPAADPVVDGRIGDKLAGVTGYKRDEAQTYLTVPEWLLVYYPDEYAQVLKGRPPSAFPYFGSIAQFWRYYWDVYLATRGKYPFNWGYHVMVSVIGSSYTVENGMKGLYENSLGRLAEWTSGGVMTQEDVFAAVVAQEYVDFIRVDPWYEFSFLREIKRLWAETDLIGPHLVRKWERKLVLSVEYLVKAQYATLITVATRAVYGKADTEILVWAGGATDEALKGESRIKLLERFDDGSALLSLPRYEEFRGAVSRLASRGVWFREMAGNKEILLTSVVPAAWPNELAAGRVVFEQPILTVPGTKRIAIVAPVERLHILLGQFDGLRFPIEHVYDY